MGSELTPAVPAQGHHGAAGEVFLQGRSEIRCGHLAGSADDDIGKVAPPLGDLAPAEAEAMSHPQPFGLDLQEPLEGLDALRGGRRHVGESLFRVIAEHDVNMRHLQSLVVLLTQDWGFSGVPGAPGAPYSTQPLNPTWSQAAAIRPALATGANPPPTLTDPI